MKQQHNAKIIMKDGTIFRITYFGFLKSYLTNLRLLQLDKKKMVSFTIDGKDVL